MRTPGLLLLAALAAAALTAAAGPRRAALRPEDRKAIETIIQEKAAVAREAWETRDASVMIPDTATAILIAPDGSRLSPADQRDALQRRMDGVARIDTMAVKVDSFLVVTPDSVLAFSTQRFVRVLRRADGYQRQRFSVVVHEQPFARRNGRWAAAAPEREINPRSWWGDEAPPAD